MASIKEIRSQRIQGLKDLRKLQRTLDSKVEILERFLLKAVKWKEKVPDNDDLRKIVDMVGEIDRATNDLVKGSVDLAGTFNF
jgi:hypothetical protein